MRGVPFERRWTVESCLDHGYHVRNDVVGGIRSYRSYKKAISLMHLLNELEEMYMREEKRTTSL